MANPWFRFYSSAIRHPKVARLSDREFRLWVKLLAVACDHDGIIPCLSDLKHLLNTRLDHLSAGVEALITHGLIDRSEDGYTPHNWNKKQFKSDSSASRVTAHREKRNVPVTPPDTETDTEGKGMLAHPQKTDARDDVARVSKPDPRGSRLPADWSLKPDIADWATRELALTRQQVEHEVPIFTDYWNAQAGAKGRKTDWDATFRNWLRRSQENRGKGHGNFKRNTPGSQLREAFAAQRAHLVNAFGEPETGNQDA